MGTECAGHGYIPKLVPVLDLGTEIVAKRSKFSLGRKQINNDTYQTTLFRRSLWEDDKGGRKKARDNQ